MAISDALPLEVVCSASHCRL